MMMLRRHFTRRWGVTPQAYRHRFSQLAGLRDHGGAGRLASTPPAM
jgi:hypothetical protein